MLARDCVLLVDDAADFGIDLAHRFFRDVGGLGNRAAQENFAFVFSVNHRAEYIAHAVARHHVARHCRGALEVVAGAGRHLIHKDFFGDPAAEQHRDPA